MARRTDAEILHDLRWIECRLSPENLSCDGELPRSEVQRRYSKLTAQRNTLVKELGRAPTDQEIWGR